jgi:phosphatidylserine synthase 2
MALHDVHHAVILVQVLDTSLGKPLDERQYGSDCRLYIPGEGWNFETIKATLFDEFVIAHTLGWFVKALIMRNYWLLWTCSIGFELMELTFQHWLLNFNECWWDSWILDVMVCNLGGLLAGMWAVKHFGSKKYNWQGMSQQKGLLNKTKCALLDQRHPAVLGRQHSWASVTHAAWVCHHSHDHGPHDCTCNACCPRMQLPLAQQMHCCGCRRGLLQFTPHTLEIWNWGTFSSPLRLFQTLLLVAVILAFELNAFFLKTLLWVPPPHYLNVVRLAFLGILALPGVKEYYAWLNVRCS